MHPQTTILLVPGAFGTPDCFKRLLPLLKDAGLATQNVPIPSSYPENPASATCAGDITHVRENVFKPAIEIEQRNVIVLAHSYGGIVAAGAAKGLDAVTRRSQGLAGGVLGLIYIAGNIALEGESLVEAVGGGYPPFIKRDQPAPGLAIIEPVMETLYGDCDPMLKGELEAGMTPHAYSVFETPSTDPCWTDAGFDKRRLYIRTVNDACNPSFLQDQWIQKSGVEWEIADFQTSHGPFVSQPQALSEKITAAALKWALS